MKLVDSSVWLDFLRKECSSSLAFRIQTWMEFKEIAWCQMIRLELQRMNRERQNALSLFNAVLVPLSINDTVWTLADEVARESSRSGRPVPNTDIVIYATALHYECQLVHNDKHFDWLDEITGKNIAKR